MPVALPLSHPRQGLLALALMLMGASAMPHVRAQEHDHHHHRQHQQHHQPATDPQDTHAGHAHGHDLGPAGASYDLRWLDAMVQHHTGALRMSEFLFGAGEPGVGALAKEIWVEQANEIRAMGRWRRAWYPDAPNFPVAWRSGADPDQTSGLPRMSPQQIEAMRMMQSTPTRENRVTWFLEGMLMHHGGALQMAHDGLKKSKNPTIQYLAQEIILSQSDEIIRLRKMLQFEGLDKPEYHQFDALFFR
jgi:uncharacterized protein (DUF305 family)